MTQLSRFQNAVKNVKFGKRDKKHRDYFLFAKKSSPALYGDNLLRISLTTNIKFSLKSFVVSLPFALLQGSPTFVKLRVAYWTPITAKGY